MLDLTPATGTAERRPGEPKTSAARARFDAIYTDIRNRICLLRYPPGHVLAETELATEFGVSRTPVRRVLHRLEYEGLVESRHGVGTIVTRMDLERLREIDALRMRLSELIGDLSPTPRHPEDALHMRALLHRCRAIRDRIDLEEFGRINIAVHEELSKAIGNQALREMNDHLFFQTARVWLQFLPMTNWGEEIDAFCGEITDLAAAMELNDLSTLGHIRRNAISMSRVRMQRYFSS